HLDLVAVEPGSIATMRALYPALRSQKAVATIIVSTAGTDIFITQEGMLQFYRRVDTGIPELRAQIGVGGPVPSAAPQIRGGLLLPGEDEPYEAPPAAPVDAVDPYNRQAISLLMTEVQRSLDYFSREFPVGDDSMLVHFSIDAPDATDLFGV